MRLSKKSLISLALILTIICGLVPFSAFKSYALTADYSASISDMDLGVAEIGYENDDHKFPVPVSNTGTQTFNLNSS